MNEKEEKIKKNQLQKKAGKFLIVFLVAMILLTVVSRISSTLTVPLVSTQKVRKDVLNYNIKGDGRIDSANTIYLDMFQNLQIEDVYVKKGQSVKKGDELFRYDMNQLKEQIEKATKEYEASQRAYEKSLLKGTMENDGSEEEKNVKRANEDYQKAQNDYEEAREVYKEKIEEIKKNLSDTQKEEYEKAEEEYDLALEAYEDAKDKYGKEVADANEAYTLAKETSNKEIKEAKAELADAQSELDEVLLKKTTLIQYMNIFEQHAKNQNYSEMYKELEKIYSTYFGKKEYADLKDKISDAQDAVDEAKDNLSAVKAKWKLIMEEEERTLAQVDPSDPEYASALNKYKQQQLEQENAIREASDAVDNKVKEVGSVSAKYTEITDTATTYFYNLAANPSGGDSTLYKKYYLAIIDSSVVDEAEHKVKNRAVEKAKAAVDETVTEQDKLVTKAKEVVDDANAQKKKEIMKAKAAMKKKAKAVDKLLDKVYEDKDGMRTARESLETQKATIGTAKRTVEDAEDKLDDFQKTSSIDEKIAEMDQEDLEDDMKTKEEVLDKLNQVLDAKGKVSSEIDGMVTALDIEIKTSITGTEKVAITPSCSVFIGSFEKEYMEYVEKGDKVSCQLTGYKNVVEGEVIDIAYNSEGDCFDVTAKLPDEKFAPGITGQFTINKSSEKYDNCIPITALRKDNSGDYVLVMKETSTILGKEFIAYRVNVTINKKDFQIAVINDVLGYDEEVITGSNRNVMEGDRVRKGSYE